MASTSSPRGVAEEAKEADSNPMADLAQNGYRAIQELERVLFFTDLKDDATRQQAATDGLNALENLEELMHVSSVQHDKGNCHIKATPSFQSCGSVKCSHLSCNTDTLTLPTCQDGQDPSYSESLIKSDTNLMELLTNHFNTMLVSTYESTQKACKEAERVLLFTDLDNVKLAKNTTAVPPGDVWKEVEVVLHDMEVKLARMALKTSSQAADALEIGIRSSQRAYKECERTLLFTDLDEVALAKDKSKDDVITHFLNSQDVMNEMQKKFFGQLKV